MLSLPSRGETRDFLETLLIATTGSLIAGWAGVPAGFLSGALVLVAAAGVAGRPTYVPTQLTNLILFTLGVVLGSAVTPETLKGISTWPLSIVFMAVALVLIFFCTGGYLRLVHKWDPLSAYFAASPGALSQVVSLAIETKADLPAIVIVQTVRVLLLSILLPLGLSAFGYAIAGAPAPGTAAAGNAWGEILILLACCAAVAFLAHRVKFPGGIIFGSMAASAVLHGGGFIEARLPTWLTIAAMIGIGSVTGSRFRGTTPVLLLRYLKAALGAFAVGICVLIVCVVAVLSLLPLLQVRDVVLAFSPGAQETMMLLALALNGAPVYVGAHHVARFTMASMALPLFVRFYGDIEAREAAEKRRVPTTMTPDE